MQFEILGKVAGDDSCSRYPSNSADSYGHLHRCKCGLAGCYFMGVPKRSLFPSSVLPDLPGPKTIQKTKSIALRLKSLPLANRPLLIKKDVTVDGC